MMETLLHFFPKIKKFYPNSFITTGVYGNLMSKSLIILKFFYEIKYAFNYKSLKKMKKTYNDKTLVMASGPSVRKIAESEIQTWQDEGNKLTVINNYFTSEMALKFIPDYYVLSDPLHIDFINDENSQFSIYLQNNSKILLFVPQQWKKLIKTPIDRTIFFNDMSLEGLTKNTSPIFPRGYLSLTAYKALSIIQYISEGSIYIIGFDNNLFNNMKVDYNNTIKQEWNNFHFDASSLPTTNILDYYHGVADYLFDSSRAFYHLRYFDKSRIINLDLESLVDIFRKKDIKE